MAASSSSSSSSALSRLSNIQNHLNPIDSLAKNLVKISPEVSEALSHGHAVVALESTIISHGMPYPQNFETAKEVEAIVRNNGAVPATIAILEGLPCVGLSTEELERLAKLGSKAQKTARRDIAHVMSYILSHNKFAGFGQHYMELAKVVYVCKNMYIAIYESSGMSRFSVATRGNGATTVSATMFFASMVGIPVFVTGGIGGVHRHGEHTMDISSDLTELGRTPVAVVSAGIKSILDIPRTLEYLETHGVCVAAYKTNEFPAFFTETSGSKVPCRVDSPEDCARLIDVNMKLKLGSGLVIGVPIPREHAASGRVIESAIQSALREAREKNITGNAETPFLLARVNELTGGLSLASNIALVKNNALIGAKISVALAQLRQQESN
ncbi:hypothetical protein WN944_009609 [Citrus x changshan-huyou]|uniref:Pseudouridine-5'-phosphate glycosidase n=2 Tax=Citrus TaxID=2706 RepID=A0AAP0MQ41_9ROSI